MNLCKVAFFTLSLCCAVVIDYVLNIVTVVHAIVTLTNFFLEMTGVMLINAMDETFLRLASTLTHCFRLDLNEYDNYKN